MNTLCRIAFVVLCSGLPSAVLADGLIYQLPPDGTWVRFQSDGTQEGSDGKVVPMTGTMTLSSVGVAEVSGEACRWIELGWETKQKGLPDTVFYKLLIPEKHLGKGQDPLAHVRKVWLSLSRVDDGTAFVLEDLKGTGQVMLKMLHPYLHGPIQNSKPLDPLGVESKLGKLNCKGIAAQERTESVPNAIVDWENTIRLHPTAPFGVVTFESMSKVQRDSKDQGKVTLKLKLVDFGKDAKSKLPDAN